jgi:hypothetical protein
LAKVLFRDGVTVVVENWSFRYEFAVSQTPDIPTSIVVFGKQAKRSRNLELEVAKMERGVTAKTPFTIREDEISCITYRWRASGRGSDELGEIVVVKRAGPPTTFASPFAPAPSDAFLTDKGYPYAKTLALVGQVKDPVGRMNERSASNERTAWLAALSLSQ